jgi:hypothetical protein
MVITNFDPLEFVSGMEEAPAVPLLSPNTTNSPATDGAPPSNGNGADEAQPTTIP